MSDDRETKKRPHPWRRVFLVAGIVLAVGALAATGYALYRYNSPGSRLAVSDYEGRELEKALDPPPSRTSTEPIYILLVGDDRRSEERARSDALILARIDPATKSAVMLSLPRDLRVAIPGHGVSKINAAYSWGGAPLAIQTVKDLTGLPIHHCVAVDFGGLTDVVDVLGGIWIDVDREINDEYRKQDPGQVWHIDKGYQKLNGAQALTYVRSRWFPEGDWVRCLHQRTFLKALVKQAQEASPTKQMLIIGIASKNLKSDMTVTEIVDLARAMKGADSKNILGRTVPGADRKVDGLWYVVPDMARLQTLCQYMAQGQVPPGSENWGVQE